MTYDPGIKPGPHWWKASALTTAPTMLPTKHVSLSFSSFKVVKPPLLIKLSPIA